MALRAGYKGVKNKDAQKLTELVDVKSIGDGLSLSSDGELSATGGGGGGTTVVANPETESTANLFRLTVGTTTYAVPDNSKVYKTDDNTESTLADSDYVPFFDSSAASGSGAPRKSTWSNIKAKLKTYFDELYNNYVLPTAAANTLGGVKVGSGLAITDGVLSNNYTLPTAAANTLGGVKVGSGLSITDGVLSATGGGGGGSYTKTLLYGSATITYPATAASTVTLSETMENFDELHFAFGFNTSNVHVISELTVDVDIMKQLVSTSQGENAKLLICDIYAGGNQYVRIGKDSNTKLSFIWSNGVGIYNVYGVKY